MKDLDQNHIEKIAEALDELDRMFTAKAKALGEKIERLSEKMERHLLQDHAPSRPALRVITGGKIEKRSK